MASPCYLSFLTAWQLPASQTHYMVQDSKKKCLGVFYENLVFYDPDSEIT